jgi:hypothetical protein
MQSAVAPLCPSIAAACTLCSSRFERYLLQPFYGTEPDARQLMQDLGRFAKAFAVYAPGDLSLDSLLRDEKDLRARLLYLLNVIAENLRRGKEHYFLCVPLQTRP